MKYKIWKHDSLLGDKLDLILLWFPGFILGVLIGAILALGMAYIVHGNYLDARCRMGLLWHGGKQYMITEVDHGTK